MLVSDVVTAVQIDMRQVLQATVPSDAAILISWVDRVHKDVLHTSLWSYYNRSVVTIPVVAGTSRYDLAPGLNARRLISVYDRTFDRIILPFESLGQPSVKKDADPSVPAQIPDAMLSAITMTQWPEYYQRIFGGGEENIVFYPAPQKDVFNGTYEITYEQIVSTLSNMTDPLLIPDDGLDLVVAGVNTYAAAYLKNPEDANNWKAVYESMKSGGFNG